MKFLRRFFMWIGGQQPDHDYTSTACFHGWHAKCRFTCKFCFSPCACSCHSTLITERVQA